MLEKKNSKKSGKQLLKILLSEKMGKKYAGKHVMIVGDRIFAAKTGEEASRKFEQLRQKYPDQMPLLTYIPKEDLLIL